MKVIKIDTPKEITLESLQAYLADVASEVGGKDQKDNEELWNKLLKETYRGKPSRLLEYIPCKVDWVEDDICEEEIGYSTSQWHGFVKWSISRDWYYTNMRELLNLGYSVDRCIDFVDFTNFKVAKCVAPYFVYDLISKHNQMTTVCHSQGYVESSLGYWYPEEFDKYAETHGLCDDTQMKWSYKVINSSPEELGYFMKKELGIKRKEIFTIGADMLKNRTFSIGGYINSPNAIPNLIGQWSSSHTQQETRELVQMLEDAWYDDEK